MEETLHEISHLGFGGVMLWRDGATWGGCLLTEAAEPERNVNAWQWGASPSAVAEELLGYARRLEERRKG